MASVVLDVRQNCVNCKKHESEALDDHIRHFKAAREILQSLLGGLILASKSLEEIHPAHSQVEDRNERRIELLLVLGKESKIDEQLSKRAYLESVH